MGIPLLTGTTIEDIVAKDGRLCQLVLRHALGQTRTLDCDGLVMTGAFRPESGLARMSGLAIDPATQGPVVDQSGRTSQPGVYAAGNLLRGVETAGWCWAEGRAVALAMLQDLPTAPDCAPVSAPAIAVNPGPGLRYVMPQRLSPGVAALPALQIRLDRPARGTLTVTDAQGCRIASLPLASAPERRVSLDLSGLPLHPSQSPLTVAVEPT